MRRLLMLLMILKHWELYGNMPSGSLANAGPTQVFHTFQRAEGQPSHCCLRPRVSLRRVVQVHVHTVSGRLADTVRARSYVQGY